MKRSTRVFILLAVFEVAIVLGAVYMVSQVRSGNWNAPDPSEAISRILSIAGGAMPLVAVLLIAIALTLRRKGD